MFVFDYLLYVPIGLDIFYKVSYYIKWVKTFWTYSMYLFQPYYTNSLKKIQKCIETKILQIKNMLSFLFEIYIQVNYLVLYFITRNILFIK